MSAPHDLHRRNTLLTVVASASLGVLVGWGALTGFDNVDPVILISAATSVLSVSLLTGPSPTLSRQSGGN